MLYRRLRRIELPVAISHGLGACAVLSPIGLASGIQASLLFYDEVIRGSYTRKLYDVII
jgi:hypothetical protein